MEVQFQSAESGNMEERNSRVFPPLKLKWDNSCPKIQLPSKGIVLNTHDNSILTVPEPLVFVDFGRIKYPQELPGRTSGSINSAAAAKSLQSCPTLCDPIEGSPPGSPRPWNSPGKNTGVGCHFLLECMKVKSESEVTQSCLTSSDPIDCSLPSSSIHEIFQARVLEWLAIAFSTINSSSHQNDFTRTRSRKTDQFRKTCSATKTQLDQKLNNFFKKNSEKRVAQRLKCLLPTWEIRVRSLGREDPLEKEMAPHSSILAWRIPWTEELGRLQSTVLQRVRHD